MPDRSASPTETVLLRASTAIHSPNVSNFGTVAWVAGRELLLESDTALRVGEALELKVNLEPIPGCALLKGIVVRATSDGDSRRSGCIVHVASVSPVDKPAWEKLLAYRSRGTTAPPSRPESVPAAAAASSAAGNSLAEGARLREATRLALKAALEAPQAKGAAEGTVKRRTREPELIHRSPAPAAAPVPTAAPPPRPAPSAAAPAAPKAAPTVSAPPKAGPAIRSGGNADVRWSATAAGGREYLEVVWQTPAAFAAAVRTQLAANVLTVQAEGAQPPCVPPIVAVLRFGALVVQTTATPSQVESFRVSYHLNLDGIQFAELRRAAAAYDRPSSRA